MTEVKSRRGRSRSRSEAPAATALVRAKARSPRAVLSPFGAAVKRQTLHGDVYKQLRHAIVSGAIKPGDMLSHRGIAQALGTSVMPVRDAVCRLVAELALVVHPNRTIGLPLLSPGKFEEICAIRASLEGLAASEAALRISADGLAALRKLDKEMKNCPDYASYMEKNQQFHFLIYEAAQMPFLLAMVEMLWLQIGPLFNYIGQLGGGTQIPDRHREAILALERGDPHAARLAVEKDIEGTRAFLASMLRFAPKPRSFPSPRHKVDGFAPSTENPNDQVLAFSPPRKSRRVKDPR